MGEVRSQVTLCITRESIYELLFSSLCSFYATVAEILPQTQRPPVSLSPVTSQQKSAEFIVFFIPQKGLTAGQSYSISVAAVNAGGTSPATLSISVQTLPAGGGPCTQVSCRTYTPSSPSPPQIK